MWAESLEIKADDVCTISAQNEKKLCIMSFKLQFISQGVYLKIHSII